METIDDNEDLSVCKHCGDLIERWHDGWEHVDLVDSGVTIDYRPCAGGDTLAEPA